MHIQKSALIIHGAPNADECFDPGVPSPSNHHWLPWLQKQLIVRGYEAHTPEIPYPYEPHYPTWKREFERYSLNHETILVGHSCGGGFLVRWLSENPSVVVGKVLLVAPWIDIERSRTTDFFDFHIDPAIATRTKGLMLFNSSNDGPNIHTSVERILAIVHHIQYREFQNYGHFCVEDMKRIEFPELLEFIIS